MKSKSGDGEVLNTKQSGEEAVNSYRSIVVDSSMSKIMFNA
jgi:hypothetical protein